MFVSGPCAGAGMVVSTPARPYQARFASAPEARDPRRIRGTDAPASPDRRPAPPRLAPPAVVRPRLRRLRERAPLPRSRLRARLDAGADRTPRGRRRELERTVPGHRCDGGLDAGRRTHALDGDGIRGAGLPRHRRPRGLRLPLLRRPALVLERGWPHAAQRERRRPLDGLPSRGSRSLVRSERPGRLRRLRARLDDHAPPRDRRPIARNPALRKSRSQPRAEARPRVRDPVGLAVLRSSRVRSARRFAVLLAGLAAGCIYPPPLPLAMAPADAVVLAEPKSDKTLAVLDFADERPEFERSKLEIDEKAIGGPWFANDRFFSFHADDGTLPADPAPPGDLRGRVTGEGAFAWYPFPNHGIGKPLVRPVAQGLADYLALSIEERGLFAKVVRAKDEAEAAAVGADVVLRGRIDRFATLLAEAHDPFVPRPDDWVQFRLLALAQFQMGFGSIGELPWLESACVGRDEDPQFFDKLNAYR